MINVRLLGPFYHYIKSTSDSRTLSPFGHHIEGEVPDSRLLDPHPPITIFGISGFRTLGSRGNRLSSSSTRSTFSLS